MFWADKTAQQIIQDKKYDPYHVDDMFTPSGFAHVGSLRGPLVHDVIFRSLTHAGAKPRFTYTLNDFDPIDGLPNELVEKFSPYMGFPLRTAPSPEPGYESFAHYFAEDFKRVLTNLGLHADFLSSYDMYHEGKFNGVIREALDNAEKIQDIYQRVSGSKKREKGWLPLQVICEKCGKLGTTRVHGWDGQLVEYKCEPEMVIWATGCGYEGKISPFDGNGKLPWKVDWPAHWKVLGVTIEGSGKDHSSAGGSRDIAKELCKEIFRIQEPYNVPYEFFLIGGKKMSSSKGLGLKAREFTDLLPVAVGRFLFIRTDYRQAVEFDPMGTMAIPDLFDEYDRCWRAYNQGGDENLARSFVLSQINTVPEKNSSLFLPRFRDIANFSQLPNVELWERLEKIKGSDLTDGEKEIIGERLTYAFVWLSKYAPDEYRYQISTKLLNEINVTETKWKFLNNLAAIWQDADDPEKLQSEIFRLAKENHINPKDAFSALYQVVLDKSHGPRAGWLLKKFPKETVIGRLLVNKNNNSIKNQVIIKTIHKPEYFEIDTSIKETYPSVSIGIALIKGSTIKKSDPGLEEEKKNILSAFQGITTEQLGTYPEIVSYRKLYKEMGVDWHSRRPSPEALLRRVALGKGLYTVNTCVDAYNLVVMKHRVSVGAFDASQVKFPTVLRFAGEGDEILLLGDEKPTKYTAKELAYYDHEGSYNIDFNYRDAQRTSITEKTTNIWINVDGIFDITPELVEKTLKESVDIIVKYCGGTVEFGGIVI